MAGRRVGEVVRIEAAGLAYGGQGVGRLDDFVVFVHDLLPGDQAQVRLVKVKKNFAIGRPISIDRESELRVDPVPCPHAALCGGCTFQQLKYERQLVYKTEQTVDILERIGGIKSPPVESIIGMDDPFRYRTAMEFTAAATVHGPALGLHRRHEPGRILALEECLLVSPSLNRVRSHVERLMADKGAVPFDPGTGRGEFMALTLRENRDGEVLAGLATRIGLDRRRMDLVRALARELFQAFPQVVGVVHETRRGRHRRRAHWVALEGRDFLIERYGNVKCRVSYGSFVQSNRKVAVKLLKLLDELFPAVDRAVDGCCGVGLMGLALAGRAKAWVGIEADESAVEDARYNAPLNGRDNFEFRLGRLERIGAEPGAGFDAAVVDPPRTGLGADAAELMSRLGVERLFYVSCSPPSLARDIGRLSARGWELEAVHPFDFFPHSHHIECLARLVRPKASR